MENVKGQLLLEVLISLTILALVIIAVVKMSTRSVKSSRVTSDNKEALNLAEEVLMDVEKEKADNTILFFTGTDGTVDCGPLGDNDEYECLVNYVFDSPPDSDSVKVEALITWEEGEVVLNRIFTKTRL
jgi:type II secretory pathway pseudopilin PulG